MPRQTHPRNREVAVLAYSGLGTFELGIVVEIFGLTRPEFSEWYRFKVCGLESGPLHATGGLKILPKEGIEGLATAGTIIIPGWRTDEQPPPRLLKTLTRAHVRGARLVTICSGVFVLAAAGLLDGRRATTHWRYVERLRALHPRVRVEPRDYGAEIANQVARRLVVSPQREGGQSQYVPAPVRPAMAGGLGRALEWAQRRLGEDLSVARWARQAAMSPRTFARRFRGETGTTPHRWLNHQRVLAAQQRLETGSESIDQGAERVGLRTAATLRLRVQRGLRT